MTSSLAIVASTTISTFLTIQFGSFKPIEVKVPLSPMSISKICDDDTCRDEHVYKVKPSITNEEGWTLVTWWRYRKAKSNVHAKEIPRTSCIVKRPTRVMKSRTEATVLLLKDKIHGKFTTTSCFIRVHLPAFSRLHLFISHMLSSKWWRRIKLLGRDRASYCV